MSLVLQSSGGGSVTIAEPTTASNFTQTLPAADGTVAILDGSNNLSVAGNLSFNSGYGSSAVAYGCRAWVNFNGTGTPAINANGNVSSITDNGNGDYTVNFTTAMPDANYSSNISARNPSGNYVMAMENGNAVVRSTTQLRILIGKYDNSANLDSASVSVSIFR